MQMFTRPELDELRAKLASDPALLVREPGLVERLLGQAEYALDCARLLDEAVHFPAEPYGEAERLVGHLTDSWNEIWNRHRYRRGGAAVGTDRPHGDRPKSVT